MSEPIRVPAFGNGEGEVIELMVKIGDRIEADQSILTLESDKAIMEIPAPKAGVIKSMKVKLGDRLKEGDELFELEVEGEAAATPAPSGSPAAGAIAVGPADIGSEGSSSVDTPEQRSHTQFMNDVTMDQIDQKLSGIEDRMDKRVERIERETDRRSAEFRREIEIRDAAFKNEQVLRDKSLDERFSSFFAIQAERDNAQLERDKRYELLADRITKAAEGAEEAAKQAATVKSNYWAAVAVQLLAVAAIIVGAYLANQANVMSAISTTASVFQAGKDQSKTPESLPPSKKDN